MTEAIFQPPIDQFLSIGECKRQRDWINYVEKFGLESEHIPDLIRMVTDEDLNWSDPESLEVWAPTHAWRALGQLKAEAAIAPLLEMFDEMHEDDWFNEEIPVVFGMIGAPAIPALQTFVADSSHLPFSRIVAQHCLEKIGTLNPCARSDCVAVLTQQLEQFTKTSPEINGFLVSYLLDLKAVESAPVMEKAFAARRVDLSIAGDWIDIQYDLDLITQSEVYELRTTIDTEKLKEKAAKPIAQPARGFGGTQRISKKSSKKK